MKGDFTRSTFDRKKHYSSVRCQQGRVNVDADWNEEMDILAHLARTTRRDVIGPCGGPLGLDADGNPLAGFLVFEKKGDLHISAGHYVVDGILVENEEDVPILEQPDLPPLKDNTFADVLAPGGTELSKGTYLAFLDVWERHLTALEDSTIREVALGGPDTASRTKAVWQVKLMPVTGEPGETLTCDSGLKMWQTVTGASTGQLTAKAEAEDPGTEPCIVPARAGYRGLENQLYRVEVHRVTSPGKITVKWSRENGSVVTAWLSQDSANPRRITVRNVGRDRALGFAADDWVELTDDSRDLRGRPGTLVQVRGIEGNVLVLDAGGPVVDFHDFPVNPKVRRWDMPGEVGEITVDLSDANHWIELEQGIQVQFHSGTLRSGDYWQVPARSATRDIEWPESTAGDPLAMLPHGILHHTCRLGLLEFDGKAWAQVHDCRRLFPPLTELTRFFQVGGDGQEAMPGDPVRMPLQVGVANGRWPVAGAKVEFQVTGGKGRLRPETDAKGKPHKLKELPCSDFATGGATRIVAQTGADGVAACCWRLDAATLSQRVKATLLEIDGKPLTDEGGKPLLTPITFTASLSVASQVAYDPGECSDLEEAGTVQEAIDLLCRRPSGGGCCVPVGEDAEHKRLDLAIKALLEKGARDLCLCLLPGDHELPGLDLSIPVEEADVHIKIVGCGEGSRVRVEGPIRLSGLKSFTLQHAAMEFLFVAEGEKGAVTLENCSEVTVAACRLHGFTAGDPGNALGALLSIADARHAHLGENLFESPLVTSFEQMVKAFEPTKVDFLVKVWTLPDQGIFELTKFRMAALDAARALAVTDAEERKRIHGALQFIWREGELRTQLSPAEERGILAFCDALVAEIPAKEAFLNTLFQMRRAAIRTRPGVALIVGPTPRVTGSPPIAFQGTLANNELDGILGLCGLPAPTELMAKVLGEESLKQLQVRLKGPERRITLTGLLGTLQMRGNQLVRVVVARDIVRQFLKLSEGPQELFNVLDCCLFSHNVLHGLDSVVVSRHMAMTAGEFTLSAILGRLGLPGRLAPIRAAVILADSSVYTANHGPGGNVVLRDASRVSAQAANLEITID